MNEDPHPCPVCGETELEGIFEICELCGWEDDFVQSGDPEYAGGANDMSLNEARAYWQATRRYAPRNRTPELEAARKMVADLRKLEP